MIPKTLFQTSLEKPEKSLTDQLTGFLGNDWVYLHFNDAEVIEFFRSHPVAGLENIVDKFNTMPTGAHKADLFRYYFLYVKGGFFLDSDAMLNTSADNVIKNYSFVSVNSYKHPKTIFQGLIAAYPGHEIIHEALLDAYEIDTAKLAKNYHLLTSNLYGIAHKYKNGNSMFYQECIHDEKTYSVVDEFGKILALHYWKQKKVPSQFTPKTYNSKSGNLIFVSLHGKDEYIDLFNLLFSSLLLKTPQPWNFTFLIQTSEKFLPKLDYLKRFPQDIQIWPTADKPSIFEAAVARYEIFNFSRIDDYENILYLDIDILIGGDLNEIFKKDIVKSLIYCLPEGLVSNPLDYYGKSLFEEMGRQDLLSEMGFTSGAILFKNTNEIKMLFELTRQHAVDDRSKGRELKCLDQPYLNYYAVSRKMAELVLMSRFMKNNAESIQRGTLIYHFPGGPGAYTSKHRKMAAFMVRIFQDACTPESWTKATQAWQKPQVGRSDAKDAVQISDKLHFVATRKVSGMLIKDTNSSNGILIDISSFKTACITMAKTDAVTESKSATTPLSSSAPKILKNTTGTAEEFLRLAANQTPDVLGKIVDQQRKKLSDLVCRHHDNTVAYGPFKGMHLVEDAHWASADRGVMTLGLYEQEILRVISTLSPGPKTFIDLGAGDGYYGIGVLVNNAFEKSYCFEISPKGRDIISRNAVLNKVAERVSIHGEATKTFYQEIPQTDLDDSMLLVDIEGGEFDIIDQRTFEVFSKSVVIIEIHEWFRDISQKIKALQKDASKTHNISQIMTSSRDLSGFQELKTMSDTNRWLLCSEGRPYLMSWLRFDPK